MVTCGSTSFWGGSGSTVGAVAIFALFLPMGTCTLQFISRIVRNQDCHLIRKFWCNKFISLQSTIRGLTLGACNLVSCNLRASAVSKPALSLHTSPPRRLSHCLKIHACTPEVRRVGKGRRHQSQTFGYSDWGGARFDDCSARFDDCVATEHRSIGVATRRQQMS